MAVSKEPGADEHAGDESCKTKTASAEYYNEWERYAKAEDLAAAEEDKAEEEERRRRDLLASLGKPSRNLGYEFRNGHKVQFPDIVLAEGEGDDEAAWRVAQDRRETGNEAFRDGSIWGAQTAVDTWGQGLLALTRIRNLRKGRLKAAADEIKKAARDAANAAAGIQQGPAPPDLNDFSTPEAWEAMGWTGSRRAAEEKKEELSAATIAAIGSSMDSVRAQQRGPSDSEVEAAVCTLQMNIAQGLLKLGQFEAAVGHCDAAIAIEPRNVKALWRKAKAVWGTRNPGLAREALNALLEVDSANAAAQALLQEIEMEEAKRRKRRVGLASKPTFQFPKSRAAGVDADREADDGVSPDLVSNECSGGDEVEGASMASAPPLPPKRPAPPRRAWLSRWRGCCRRKQKPA